VVKTRLVVYLLAVFLVGCGDTAPRVKCNDDTQCTLPGKPGICLADEHVCAVPDTNCPSGYRYDATSGKGGCVVFPSGTDLSMGNDMAISGDGDMSNVSPMDMTPVPPDLTGIDMAQALGRPTWKLETTGVPAKDLLGVWGSSSTDIYVVGAGGTILHSTGNGTWTAQTSNTSENLYAVSGSGPGDVYIVGKNATVLHSTGNGSWTAQNFGVGTTLNDFTKLWVASTSDVWALREDVGYVYHTTGNGTWNYYGLPTSSQYVRALSGWSTTALIGGTGFIAAGNTTTAFAKQSVTTTEVILDLHARTSDEWWASATNGKVFFSAGGGTWNPIDTGLTGSSTFNVKAIWAAGAGDVYIGVAGGTIYHMNSSQVWSKENGVAISTFISDIWGSSANDLYSVGGSGALFHAN